MMCTCDASQCPALPCTCVPAIITIDALVKEHTLDTMKKLGGNKHRVASALGITVKTLYNWLHQWDMFEEFSGFPKAGFRHRTGPKG